MQVFHRNMFNGKSPHLRILAMQKAKNSKIRNFWTFWSVIQLINHLFKIRQNPFLPNAP